MSVQAAEARKSLASPQALVEIGAVVAAVLFGAIAITIRPDADLLVGGVTLIVAALAAWIAAHDLRTMTIPDGAVVALAVVALAARWCLSYDDARTMIALAIDGLLPGGALLAFREIFYRRTGFDGLGLGDVKLAAAGGLLVGVEGFAWALFGASTLALVAVALWRVSGRGRIDRVAFGVVLAPAIVAVWFAARFPLLAAAFGP